MKRNALFLDRNIDEAEADRMAAMYPESEEERKRVFAKVQMPEENAVHGEDERFDGAEVVSISSGRGRLFPIKAAASLAAVIAVFAGIFGAIKGSNIDAAPAQEQCLVSTGDLPDEIKNVSSQQPHDETTPQAASSANVNANSSSNQTKREDTQPQRGESEASAPPQALISASEALTDIPPQEIDSTGYCPVGEDDNTQIAEVIIDSEPENTDSEEIPPYARQGCGLFGRADSADVLKIKRETTYAQIFELLGEPNTCETDGYAEYIIDGSKLLLLFYDDENDMVGADGSELLDTCYSLTSLHSDPEKRTFDCIAIKMSGNYIRVTCPQYPLFDCCDLKLTREQYAPLAAYDLLQPFVLRVTHTDVIEESYPAGVYAEKIMLDIYK